SESTDLSGAWHFVLRQIVCVELHHVYWWSLLCMNAATIVSFVAACLIALSGIVGAVPAFLGNATQASELTAFALIPGLYVLGLLTALTIADRLVRRIVAAPPRVADVPRLVAASLVALSFTTNSLFVAPFLRSIDWRGITYDIEGRNRIRMRAYRPYRNTGDKTASSRSIL